MKMFYKSKHGIVLMVVLTLMMQIVGPVVGDYVYAEPKMEVDLDIDGESPDTNERDETKPTDSEEVEGDEDPTEAVGGELEGETEAKDESEKQEEAGLIELEDPVILPLANGVPKDLGNIFTLDSFKVNEAEASENMVVIISDGTTVNLDYTWNTVGKDAKSGDWAEIDVPDAFKLDRTFENQDIVLSGGEIVGKYSLINNKLRFVFNDEIENVGEVTNGIVGFEVKFNEEKFQEDVVEEIEFNDTSDKTITIIGEPRESVSTINKKGEPDSTTNAKKITWTVDITNPSNTEIINAKLKDILPEGLEIDASSVKVKDLNIKLNGDLSEGNEITVASPQINGQNFELDLLTIDPYKGYRIEYTTVIIDQSKTKFTNDASFEYGEEKLPAKATVSIERSADIEKDGKYLGNDGIEWWIDVNKSGGSIENAIVEDTLPTELSLVPGSIEIFKLTQDGDNWNESSSDKTASNFPVTLGNIDGAYRIKFKTSIDYSQVNGGEYQKNNSFKNETTLKNGENEIGEAEKIVDVTRDPILSKTGKQYVDYEKKEIKWTVTVNKANHPINNAIVTDILPKGLTISKDDIRVLKGTEDVTDNVTITVPDNDGTGSTEVTIALGDINEKYTIEYTTKITDFNIDKFLNGASLGGTGVGTGGTINPVPVYPNKNSYSKSYKDIDYNEKTMSWETVANPTREAFKTFKITDTFPNHGLILLPDTLEVKVGGVVKVLDTDYTLTAIDSNYNNGFVVEFIGEVLPINAKIVMTYKTSYDPEKGIKPNTSNGLYKNEAKFEGKTVNNNDVDVTKDAKKQVNPETVNTGKKVGKLISIDSAGNLVDGWHSGNERKIEWEVYTNYLKQTLGSGVSITDELGYEGEIDENSIQVRKYTVAPGGGTTLGDDINTAKLQLMELLSTKKYSVVMGENNKSFTLTFNEAVNERYAVIFTTSVPNTSLGKYTNTATLKVGDKEYPYTGSIGFNKADNKLSKEALNTDGSDVYTDDEIDWKIKINESLSIVDKDVKIVDTISSGMVYKEGSLKVYKLQGTEKVLVEDEYTLTKSTNDDGETVLEIVFNDSISSTYEIEYTTVVTATGGTVNNSVEYSGKNEKIDSVETTKLNAKQFSYIGGDPSKGKIIINKVDSEEEKITAEAEFEVYYLLNGEKQLVGGQTYKTIDGKIEIGNLRLNRTYYIREIAAPNGFKFDPNHYPMEVFVNKAAGKKDSGAYKFDIENENITTQVTGIKEWINGPQIGPEIQLQLYRNGEAVKDEVVTLKDGKTSHTWKGLNLTDNAGIEYKYTVDEVEVPENYKKKEKVQKDLTVTNTYVIPKIQVKASKVWVDGSTPRPEIWFKLYRRIANGKDEEVINVNVKKLEDDATEVSWEDLDKTDIDGNEYIYSVIEVNQYGEDFKPVNYEKAENGLEVTNTYVSPTDASAKAIKEWINGPQERPTIWFKLYRQIEDGDIEEVPLEEAPIKELRSGTTEVVWSTLTKTNSEGQEYIFSIKEVDKDGKGIEVNDVINNYRYDGIEKNEKGEFVVTNTYVIPKTNIAGRKEWIGGPSRKPTIELQLYKDGVAFETPVRLVDGETEYTWVNLDETDINGRVHKYTVDEVRVPGDYRKSISQDGLTITNRYSPYYPPGPGGGDPIDPDPKDPPKEDPKDPDKPVDPEDPKEEDPKEEDPETPDPTDPTDPADPDQPETEDPVDPDPTDPEEDPEEPPTTIVLDPPTKGTVTIDEDGKWIYTPKPGETGKDKFTIVHPDGREELIEIDLDDLPLGTTKVTKDTLKKLPKTGAASNLGFYFAGLSLIFLGIFLRRRIA